MYHSSISDPSPLLSLSAAAASHGCARGIHSPPTPRSRASVHGKTTRACKWMQGEPGVMELPITSGVTQRQEKLSLFFSVVCACFAHTDGDMANYFLCYFFILFFSGGAAAYACANAQTRNPRRARAPTPPFLNQTRGFLFPHSACSSYLPCRLLTLSQR